MHPWYAPCYALLLLPFNKCFILLFVSYILDNKIRSFLSEYGGEKGLGGRGEEGGGEGVRSSPIKQLNDNLYTYMIYMFIIVLYSDKVTTDV